MRAGELECALADAESPFALAAAKLTDELAAAVVNGRPAPADIIGWLAGIETPEMLQVSTPEGFAYYGLHPLAYADLARGLDLKCRSIAIVGIRSIGTTLSAVVRAETLQRGFDVERITVRPVGHPFDRRCEFDGDQRRWLAEHLRRDSEFLVVDEGPGLSGSSFLSVGEALIQHGVSPARITFLTAHEPAPERLRTRDAAPRWSAFRCACLGAWHQPPEDGATFIGTGEWRRYFCGDQSRWPASWTWLEAPKYLSSDRARFYKFDGYGRFGRVRHERSLELTDSGYSPRPLEWRNGWACYPVIEARTPDLNVLVLDRMAQYCAFRRNAFPSEGNADLAFMTRLNFQEEFGAEPEFDDTLLRTGRAVICDGRMAPNEWLLQPDGQLLKLDATSHGDDHFYPGPADIAWDIAGAIVEWNMSPSVADSFVERYRRASGDDPQVRVPAYIQAYLAFRMAYCRMAAEAMAGNAEESRLRREYQRYRAVAEARLEADSARFTPATR